MPIKGDFEKLWEIYPKGFSHNPALSPAEDELRIRKLNEALKKKIGGQVNNPAYTNLCAVRLSLVLNGAGLKIPAKTFLKWYGENFHVVKGADGSYYGHGVLELFHYFSEKYGKPDLELSKTGESDDPSVQAALKGKKGILFFKVNIWNDAQGHFTLWDGEKCADNGYFREAVKVALWKVAKPVAARGVRLVGSNDTVHIPENSGDEEIA
jgi:hypothetical protein